MDDHLQRFRGRRNCADQRLRKFQDEEELGGYRDAHGRYHPVGRGRLLDAENYRGAKDQPANQEDGRPQRPRWADVHAGQDYSVCA